MLTRLLLVHFGERPLRADIVAKVFLRGGTQILRPVDAAI